MKRYIYILISLLTLTSCVSEELDITQDPTLPDGYVKIEFNAQIAEPNMVTTRAVDPDGMDVSNMTLFCFNEFGLYINSVAATIKTHNTSGNISDSGTYSAAIPSHTHIIHFVANHSEGLYDDSDFPGQTENMVIANMEGGSGMLVYWSRFQMDPNIDKTISDQIKDHSYTFNSQTINGIKLIRNQAKVTIDNWESEHFTVTGFRTVNIPAFGTVAPHHPEMHFNVIENWETTEDFVTLPSNQALMSDIVDINTKTEDYIFESANSGDEPISVIIKGHNAGETEDKYYRIVMQNDDGSNIMIRRNHHYNLIITGALSFGQDTFAEALTASASNNAWISIDEWVNEITDGIETLWVEQTSYVLSSDEYAGTNWTFPYKYTHANETNTAPSITWIENNIAYNNITNTYDPSTGEGEVTLRLFPMYEGNEQQSGSLLIKHGKLQRKVDINIIRTQHFTPAWTSSQVYGDAGENVTIVFTIPETCPETLFPFTVLVTVNHLDVRSSSGQKLPIYIKGEEGYFGQDWGELNYKYAYTVTGPGKHRLHMQSILQHEENDTEDIHLEAEFFETITKQVIFRGYNNAHRRIFISGLHSHGNHYAEDELLYYMLLPQKKAAPIVFTLELQERQNDNTYSALNHLENFEANNYGKDEFLVYTKSLSFYDDYFSHNPGTYDEIKDLAWEGEVTMIREDTWSTNGRVMAFRTYQYDESLRTSNPYGLQEDGTYNIYMLTNSSYNKDVVRVSSNSSGNTYAFEKVRDYLGTDTINTLEYKGNEYRSIIFDIAHYRPYRFAAQVQVSSDEPIPATNELLSNETHLSTAENVDNVLLSYKPGQNVDILFDITSFRGSDGRSVHPFGEYFGESFDVYIDAPMLDIDEDRVPDSWKAANNTSLTADKLRKHPSIPGRFIYTVEQNRADERAYGIKKDGTKLTAINKDISETEYNKFGQIVNVSSMDQEGERKLLPFKKTTITAGGDIVISTDKDKVIFWDKTFHVDTEHIKGKIQYEKNGVKTNIPKDAFVAFVRLRTNARIGVVTITEDGSFELNLRDEYQFSWEDDPIDFYYKDTDGKVYNFNYTDSNGEERAINLDLLYELVVDNGKEIVLTESN